MHFTKFIVNPAAGAGGTARKWTRIMVLLKSLGMPFEHEFTEAPGHATELASNAVKQGYQQVVSVGGDGTMNEIINGLYSAGGNGDVALGIIGTGTGGDYSRTIGLHCPYPEICQRLLKPHRRKVDIGIVEYQNGGHAVQRIFANFAGAGFDAEIVRRTSREYKSLGSMASYLMGTFTTLVSFRNQEVSLVIDGEPVKQKVCTVIMNNGKYGGGGMLTAPGADLTDGLFDVLIVGDLDKFDLLRSLPRIYKGTHLTHPKVTLKRAKEVTLKPAKSLPLQADGELLGEAPASFRILPAALDILV
ncbi:MAG: diacylglycerol kinase family lipid kinase [Dehalococcoidales bacterium]|nr:diacylglycerol kinase family lipid kinase [Dehalococcoidales bacterium]